MNDMDKETIQELEKEIAEQKWIFAKTYAKTAPHEYIVKKSSPEFFDKMCRLIDSEGYNARWRDGKEYKYLKIGTYKYWHFDIILNREKIVSNIKK
jgi:hypothetical protein